VRALPSRWPGTPGTGGDRLRVRAVSVEAFLLGLTTVVRPTSAAAVFAMLCTPRPKRLLIAFVAAGLALTLSVGVAFVLVFQGHESSNTTTAGRALLSIVVGTTSVGYGAGVSSGRLLGRSNGHHGESWLARRMHHLTLGAAALIGIVTHLPGIIYLAALNAIVGSGHGPLNSVLQVLVYNALWFSVPIVALVLSAYRPTTARDMLARGTAWVRLHERSIVGVFCLLFGLYLVVKGIMDFRAVRS
jgi:hypothetical protein